MATILMIFLRINCSNVIGLVWRCGRNTKFQIGMAVAIPAIPLPAPLCRTKSNIAKQNLQNFTISALFC